MKCLLSAHERAYRLSFQDGLLSVGTLFSGAPYAKRHWDLSNRFPEHRLGHRVIAVLEALPVAGLVFSLIERIAAFLTRSNPIRSPQKQQQIPTPLTPERLNSSSSSSSAPSYHSGSTASLSSSFAPVMSSSSSSSSAPSYHSGSTASLSSSFAPVMSSSSSSSSASGQDLSNSLTEIEKAILTARYRASSSTSAPSHGFSTEALLRQSSYNETMMHQHGPNFLLGPHPNS